MGSVSVEASQWRLVEVGRVVLFASGPFAGRLASIVEIVDHKRVRLRPWRTDWRNLEAYWRNARGKTAGIGVNMNMTGPR